MCEPYSKDSLNVEFPIRFVIMCMQCEPEPQSQARYAHPLPFLRDIERPLESQVRDLVVVNEG